MANKSRKPEQNARVPEQTEARRLDAGIAGDLPADYATLLTELKQRIREERVRMVLAANAAMVLL